MELNRGAYCRGKNGVMHRNIVRKEKTQQNAQNLPEIPTNPDCKGMDETGQSAGKCLINRAEHRKSADTTKDIVREQIDTVK